MLPSSSRTEPNGELLLNCRPKKPRLPAMAAPVTWCGPTSCWKPKSPRSGIVLKVLIGIVSCRYRLKARKARGWRCLVPDHRERGDAAQLRARDDGSGLRRVQTDIGKQVEDGVDRAVDLDLGDKLADAHVRAETETEGRLELAVDVE